MSFAVLALVMALGLFGPLLATPRRWQIPVVIGELLAGLLIGRTGFNVVDSADPTFSLLGNIGFALIMFVAGTHVPLRNTQLRSALAKGAGRAVAVAALSVAFAVVIALSFSILHAPLYAVLIASSSAALVLPIIESSHLDGPEVLALTAQVAIADAAAIIALPLAIDPPRAGIAALGVLVIAGCAALLFVLMRSTERSGLRSRVRAFSEQRKFALELRLQLIVLFALAALAMFSQVSIMLAGFSFGLAVSAVGQPRRLARQLFAITEGFFGPVFFLWIGASLNLRELLDHPPMILLGLALGVAAILSHLAIRALGLPWPLGILSAAQLGVPVAAVAISTQSGLLLPGEASALILGSLLTIAASSLLAHFPSSVHGKPRARSEDK
ncbi:Kef-type K+ transport system membrane component KefB [Psychromicrobium silvestre]|uniref:Kef-type K+ transport system membrane component KefB n=1 Tax=Psychromicrobium silvestre TaxID=1645614 RepID=A0A7Y9LUF7_9MICC|nr:cation:proton antiporter [Psychromicrobium silvestre]NYE95829.1 Kef-type K+ transport system membrane component KefB [Psychromicrobium silvestre]